MPFDAQFQNMVALVTGAGTGMGADTAVLLAERGAKLVLVGRREAPLREIQQRIASSGGEALVVPADVSDPAAVQAAIENAVEHFGVLHYAANNAGISNERHELPDLPDVLWDETFAINLSSLFYCMRAELPEIEKAGGVAIVNASSILADRGLPQRAACSASKHGIRGLTRSAALDWAARGVRINELQPSVIATPMTESGGADENERITATIAAKRAETGREIATAVAFLISDDASYVTGAHLAVDGGFLA